MWWSFFHLLHLLRKPIICHIGKTQRFLRIHFAQPEICASFWSAQLDKSTLPILEWIAQLQGLYWEGSEYHELCCEHQNTEWGPLVYLWFTARSSIKGLPKMVVPNNHGFSYWKWSFWGVKWGVPPFEETPISSFSMDPLDIPKSSHRKGPRPESSLRGIRGLVLMISKWSKNSNSFRGLGRVAKWYCWWKKSCIIWKE